MAPKTKTIHASTSSTSKGKGKAKATGTAASNVKVTLKDKDEEKKWAIISNMDHYPSRYPCKETISGLGIEAGWEEMCRVGRLNTLFDNPEDSYKVLTTEFLSTLQVQYTDKEPESFKCRLRNTPINLTCDELSSMFNFREGGIGTYFVPLDYDCDELWNAITISEGEDATFRPNRAKCNKVRNPTFRYMLKTIACLPFARVAAGAMQQDDLLLLWTLLYKEPLHMGQFIIRFLERQSRKLTGGVSCGGVVTSIAKASNINLEGLVPDQGPKMIDFDALRAARIINVDVRGQGYFLQDLKDDFPFPDPPNTLIHGYEFRVNWKMNTEVHNMITRSNPAHDWASSSTRPYTPIQLIEGNAPVNDPPPQPTFQRNVGV